MGVRSRRAHALSHLVEHLAHAEERAIGGGEEGHCYRPRRVETAHFIFNHTSPNGKGAAGFIVEGERRESEEGKAGTPIGMEREWREGDGGREGGEGREEGMGRMEWRVVR